MAAYGTIMIATLAEGKTSDDWVAGVKEWEEGRNVAGFSGQYLLVGDDGRKIVSCVIFESKESYMALADDPEQDKWWNEKARPLLAGEPEWIDGYWP